MDEAAMAGVSLSMRAVVQGVQVGPVSAYFFCPFRALGGGTLRNDVFGSEPRGGQADCCTEARSFFSLPIAGPSGGLAAWVR